MLAVYNNYKKNYNISCQKHFKHTSVPLQVKIQWENWSFSPESHPLNKLFSYNISAHTGLPGPLICTGKFPGDDCGVFPHHFWFVLSIRVQAAVSTEGGSCDGGCVALSVCPAGGRTAVVPLVRRQPGLRTPWTAGPGSVPAFSQHSGLPVEMCGLQGGDNNKSPPVKPCVRAFETHWVNHSEASIHYHKLLFIMIIYSWMEQLDVLNQPLIGLSVSLPRLLIWPEQSRAVAVSRVYSASVTRSVAMLWKKLSTGSTRSSLPPVHTSTWEIVHLYVI